MLRKLLAESWTAKLLHVVAFVAVACTAYFLLLRPHDWVAATYPALDNPAIGILIGLVLAAPVYRVEDRFLRRLAERDITQFPSPLKPFRPIQPVTMGIVIGCFMLFAASSRA